jgi:hypothetical protein
VPFRQRSDTRQGNVIALIDALRQFGRVEQAGEQGEA